MYKNISRRELLKVLAVVAGKLGLGALTGCAPLVGRAAQALEPRAYLPLVMGGGSSAVIPTPTDRAVIPKPTNTPTLTRTLTGSRVVHVHDSSATSWNGQTDFWNYVNQAAVDTMVDQGMMALTGAATVVEAWESLLPNYSPGEFVAIKVNFNNSTACNDADAQIDALMQPVNAVVRGLKLIGVPEANIWIYDATRRIPDRFVAANLYRNVVFRDVGCRQGISWSSTDPNASVTFRPPAGHPAPPATRIDDVLINCTYLINMPILKPHRIAGISLTFKNHFGDITSPWNLHSYIRLTDPLYRPDYNPLVDIYRNPHIAGKTVLVLGDGLIAAHDFDGPPSLWSTFGNQPPNSLFFAADPVAIDCVMCDFLAAEMSIPAEADDYLVLAAQAGLGTYERGDPWGAGYTVIDYVKNNPTAVTLVSFEAAWYDSTVLVTWETAMELDNVGFNLYRGNTAAGPWTRLNATLIPPKNPGGVVGALYEWRDDVVAPHAPIYYRLEDVDIYGKSTFHGPISVTNSPSKLYHVYLPLALRH